ncbi:MAG: ATP-binding protein [Acholeplasmataceae bacterium]
MLKDMLLEIKQFSETKHIDVKEEDIIVVYQYVLEKKAYLEDTSQPYEPILLFNPTRIELKPSKVYQEKLFKTEKLKNIDRTYHNDYLLDAYLKDFDAFNEERKDALEQAQNFINNYLENKFTKGLYVYGQNRTGKTFLLSAIANELAIKDIKIVFAYMPDLIRNIHSGMNDNTLESKVKQLKECQVLIFDDLGSAVMSSWFRDQVFGAIIQYRLSLGLPVIISSNLTLKLLESHMIDPKIDNDRFNTTRIATRIHELTTPVKLTEKRYSI